MSSVKLPVVKKCPYCGSKQISKPKLSARSFAIAILLFGFPIPFIGREYHCFRCKRDFKKRDIKQNLVKSQNSN